MYILDYGLGMEKVFTSPEYYLPYNSALRCQEKLSDEGIGSILTKVVDGEERIVREVWIITTNGISTIEFVCYE